MSLRCISCAEPLSSKHRRCHAPRTGTAFPANWLLVYPSMARSLESAADFVTAALATLDAVRQGGTISTYIDAASLRLPEPRKSKGSVAYVCRMRECICSRIFGGCLSRLRAVAKHEGSLARDLGCSLQKHDRRGTTTAALFLTSHPLTGSPSQMRTFVGFSRQPVWFAVA